MSSPLEELSLIITTIKITSFSSRRLLEEW